MDRTPDWAAQDLEASRAKRIDELIFVPQRGRSATHYHIEIPSAGKFFRVGWAEYAFLSLLDGENTFAQAVTRMVRALGPEALSRQQALRVYTWALDNGLIRLCEAGKVAAAATRPKSGGWGEQLARWNPLWIKIPLGNPDRLLTGTTPWLGWLFTPAMTVAGVLLFAVAGSFVLADWNRFRGSASEILSPDNWVWLGVAWVVLKVCHETAHGLVAKRYRGEVRETGLILAFLAPTAYVDVTSCWRFSSKWQRIHVAVAGMYVEMLLAAVAACWWSVTTHELTSHVLHNVVVMASVTTVLFNANPLMRLDGYYILSDWLDLPNLATDGDLAWRRMLRGVFWGAKSERVETLGWRRWFVPCYGIAACGWRAMVTMTLLATAWHWAAGAGVVVCIVAAAAWFAQPLWRVVRDCHAAYWESPVMLFRAAGIALLGVVVVSAAWNWLPWPGIAASPGVVEYGRNGLVRSRTDGFVRVVHVLDGQHVRAGDVLLELENQELTNECAAVALEMQQLAVRRRVAQDQRDASELQVLQRYELAMEERWSELCRRRDALHIRAPVDGLIVGRRLAELLGTYVREGEELLAIGQDDQKEFVLSLPQEQVEQARQRLGQPIPLRIGLRTRVWGTLERIEPRATRELPHAALGAHTGGPLAVEASDDDPGDPRLVEPRFRAIVALSATEAKQVSCGEVGRAMFGLHAARIGERIRQLTRNVWNL